MTTIAAMNAHLIGLLPGVRNRTPKGTINSHKRKTIHPCHTRGRPPIVRAFSPLVYPLCPAGFQRSVKYKNIYLHAYETGTQLRRGLTEYFAFYNARRTHQALDYQTPDDVYSGGEERRLAA